MFLRSLTCLAKGERGLYFPINHRIIDKRIHPSVTVEADVQSRRRRELRTGFTTGATRQTEPPAWSRKARPTHFLSLPLPAKNALTGRVNEMHKAMVFRNQQVEELLVPTARLHVTLSVLTLPADGQPELLAKIQECVQSAAREAQKPHGIRLGFRGLGTFNDGRVLFARCTAEQHFRTLDQLVRRLRYEIGGRLGVDMKGNPHDSYVPHVTVAKIRPAQRDVFGSRIPAEIWADYQHEDFGEVAFPQIDLCNMKGSGANGYYKIESSVTF